MDTRAAIYTRVSSKHQAQDGFSLAVQRERLSGIAQHHGWEYEVFEDPGISGETLEGRPAMLALLGEVRAGRLDVLLVMDESRLSRDNFVGGLIRRDLKAAGVRLVTPSGERNLSIASEELTSVIVQAAAAYEQQIRKEKSRAGLAKGAAEGYWMGGPAPYGYKASREGAHTRLTVDEEEAQVLRHAVGMVLDKGLSTWEACDRLNRQGLRTRRGNKWLHQNLRRHLKSESLKGCARWAKGRDDETLIEFPGILDDDRWDALQTILEAVAVPNRSPNHEYPLSGRLISLCGAHMYGTYRKDRDMRQYRCFANQFHQQDRCSCNWRPKAASMESAVWRQVLEALSEPERLLGMAEDYLAQRRIQEPQQRAQTITLARKVSSLERAYTKTVTEYAKAGLDGVAVKAATTNLQEQLDAARQRLAQAQEWDRQSKTQSTRMRSLWEIAELAQTTLRTMDLSAQKHLLALLDVRVVVTAAGSRYKPGEIEINGVLFESLVDAPRELGKVGGVAPSPSS